MNSRDNLQQIVDQIITDIHSRDLKLFLGHVFVNADLLSRVLWTGNSDDWKSFLDIAEVEGAKTIILDASEGDEEYLGQVGSLKLSWMRDNVVYSFTQETDWWQDWLGKDDPEDLDDSLHSSKPSKILQKKTVAQLADDALAFLHELHPDADHIRYGDVDLFWDQQGIDQWSLDPDSRFKLQQAEALVRQKVEEENTQKELARIQREKELVPPLVDKCVDWARENHIKRVTKSNLDYFLMEQEASLTEITRDIIQNKVNFLLKQKK